MLNLQLPLLVTHPKLFQELERVGLVFSTLGFLNSYFCLCLTIYLSIFVTASTFRVTLATRLATSYRISNIGRRQGYSILVRNCSQLSSPKFYHLHFSKTCVSALSYTGRQSRRRRIRDAGLVVVLGPGTCPSCSSEFLRS